MQISPTHQFSNFIPLLHIAYPWNNMSIFLSVETRIHILSVNYTSIYIIYIYILTVLVCANVFILSFLLLYSVLVYNGYTNADTGP